MNLEVDPLYVEARRVLLDALDALVSHLEAVVVVGAQAVYLRTGAIDLAIAPFTTDGDLALDPSRLEDEPTLGDAMDAAGFRLEPHDKPEPGIWLMTRRVNGMDTDFLDCRTTLPENTGVRSIFIVPRQPMPFHLKQKGPKHSLR